MEISIVCDGMHENQLREFLLSHVELTVSGEISVHAPAPQFRSLDPTVVVAIVGAGSGAIGALLSGVLQLARERRTAKIVLQGSDGTRMEIPADTPSQRLDELVEKVRMMSQPRILLGSSGNEVIK